MNLQSVPFQTIKFDEIDSTSGYLKTQLKAGKLKGYNLCIAQSQTGGYGQRGREWVHSDQSLAFSLSVPFDLDIHHFSFLSSYIALLLRKCLASHSLASFQVKWPNDIFVNDGKVAGSLLEMTRNQCMKESYLVIGVGINLSEIKNSQDKFKSNWIPDLNSDAFLTEFCTEVYKLFAHQKNSLKFNPEEWLKYDFFNPNQPVIVYHSGHSKVGLYKGLTRSAEVQVAFDGNIEFYQSGAVSIRPLTSEKM